MSTINIVQSEKYLHCNHYAILNLSNDEFSMTGSTRKTAGFSSDLCCQSDFDLKIIRQTFLNDDEGSDYRT